MILDAKQLSEVCSCGKSHKMLTRAAVIEPGALHHLESYLAQYGITGSCCAIYDENTYAATKDRHPPVQQKIILPAPELHADEYATEKVLKQLSGEVNVLLAIGGGVIHDITRYCAHKRGLRFVACPTAASVDGFCSTVAAMTWHGFKKTLPGIAPELVIADTQIIRNAPLALAKSGVGDILAKYTALTDWKISHVLTGEYICPRICDMVWQAADSVAACVDKLATGETEAFEKLTYALILSGLAMQMMGNSRPASGCEHHISHLLEMEPQGLQVHAHALHGEKTGVGCILAAREYKKLAKLGTIAPHLCPYTPLSEDEVLPFFGATLCDDVLRENQNDCLASVTREALLQNWPQVRALIAELPDPDDLYRLLERLDARRTPEDIGLAASDVETVLNYSPLVRNRLTLMRIRRLLTI